jgi:hypothetical protein
MAREKITRNTQLAKREAVKKQLRKVFLAVEDGYGKQIDRADENIDYWDSYICKLGARQSYNGNSQLFVPLIHNAVEARKTRFLNQLFPQTGRYVEVTTEDGQIPHPVMALMEGYVERAKLKTKVVPALLVSGDIEGQYTLCVTWGKKTLHTVSRETSPLQIGGIDMPDELGDVMTLNEEVIEDAGPEVEIVPDSDLLIMPVTAETVEGALAVGGSVTTICRWTLSRVEELIEGGEIDSDLSAELLVEMRAAGEGTTRDTAKRLAEAAGIRVTGKYLLAHRTWTMIEVDGEKRLVLAYYGGDNRILGCKLCPYWCDKPDILSVPVRKMPGVAKGMSLVKPCVDMQYAANDAINEGMDSATYGLLPVIMTDPLKNPKVGSMVMDLMAVWETSPKDTQVLTMPPLYQHAFNIVQAAERYIMATLGVNAAMLPQSTGVPGRKRNQAEIAMEQQIDLLSTNVEISAVEGLLSDLVGRFAEYDAQFRDAETTVRSVGELGVKAEMMKVEPLQMGKRWRFRWFGAEAARTAQQAQQQIAGLPVLEKWSQHPAVREAGYKFNPIPVLLATTETVYGPRVGAQIFTKDDLAFPPELENQMLEEKFDLPVSSQDDIPKHIQVHMQLGQHPDAAVRAAVAKHIALHQRQMLMKQAAQAMRKLAKAAGGGAGRGPAAGPRPGAQPAMPRQGRQPPGAIHPDQMPRAGGVLALPRRTG